MNNKKRCINQQSRTNRSDEYGHLWGFLTYYYKSDTFCNLWSNIDNMSDTFCNISPNFVITSDTFSISRRILSAKVTLFESRHDQVNS